MELLRDQRGIIGEAILVIFAIALVVYVFGRVYKIRHSASNVTDFKTCLQAGYPAQQSYPEVCRTPDGRSFQQY